MTNTGSRAGDAVPEVYIAAEQSSVPRPPKELKGFARVTLQPGKTRRVTVPLTTRSFAYYDVDGKQWRAAKGVYDVQIGTSSEQIELKGNITLTSGAIDK